MTSQGDGGIPWQEPKSANREVRSPGLVEALQRQFREVMKQLASSTVVPKPRARRRKTEDIRGGFGSAGAGLLRRIFSSAHMPVTAWCSLTWFRQWESLDEFEYADGFDESCLDSVRPEVAQEWSDLSPRL
jgi:hypothetical protein